MERRLRLVWALLLLTPGACGAEPTAPAVRSTEPSSATAPVVSDLIPVVERARGLQFRDQVKVQLLSEPLPGRGLHGAADPEDLARLETVLTILDLLPPEADLPALMAASDRSRVAFYDPAAMELVVVEDRSPFVRSAVVRELAKALDDQHFGIDREIPGGDAAAAFEALVEGSAALVEARFVSSLPEDERRQAEGERDRIREAMRLPPAVDRLVSFARDSGMHFVEALVEEGPDRLAGAFSSPPASSEQILDPARYLSGDTPQQVGPPRTEGAVLDEGQFGAVLLRVLLESKLDPAAAREASTGWDGDAYATWRSPDGRTCIRVQFAADTPEDARQIQAGLAAWVDGTTDREVDSAGMLLKACGAATGRP